MKKVLLFTVFISVLLTGCIRHYDQQLNRKARTTKADSLKTTNVRKLTPVLMVKDVREAMEFYRSLAGFETIVTLPDTGAYDFAIIGKGNAELQLQRKESFAEELPEFVDKAPYGTMNLYVEVADVLQVYSRASSMTPMIKDLHQTAYGTKEFTIKDKDGYLLTFSEALKK